MSTVVLNEIRHANQVGMCVLIAMKLKMVLKTYKREQSFWIFNGNYIINWVVTQFSDFLK